MLRVWVCAWLVLAAVPAAAQKPVGAFSCEGAPAWVSICAISAEASDEAILAAVARSQTLGSAWVAQIGYWSDPRLPAGPIAAEARARFERLGLWPHVIAISYGEEWYEHYFADHFAIYGLPASHPAGVPIIHAWLGLQQQSVKAVTGKWTLWITASASRPIPAFTDFVALDAYVPDGESFAATETALLSAETATSLPLVLIPRWFKSTGPKQGPLWHTSASEPTREAIEGYARVFRRPRWVAALGFLWGSRPSADLVGLADMPVTRARVERAFGVQ